MTEKSEIDSHQPVNTNMKKKLETRKSAQYLLSLEGTGILDSRSELGTVVNIAEWEHKPIVKFHCECEHVKDNEEMVPSHIIITDVHLYILRHTDKRNHLVVRVRRTLKTIMKITTKARMSDAVKLQYGSKGADGVVLITDSDRLHIPGKAGLAIKAIKSALVPTTQHRRQSISGQSLSACRRSSRDRRPSLIAEHGHPSTSSSLEHNLARPTNRRSSISLVDISPGAAAAWNGCGDRSEEEPSSTLVLNMRKLLLADNNTDTDYDERQKEDESQPTI